MKILMLTPYLPYPPASGGQVRSFNLIKVLGKKHQIHLVALIKEKKEEEFAKTLKKYCQKIYLCYRKKNPWELKNILRSIFGFYPFLVVRNYSQQAKKILKELLQKEKFDLIHVETFYVMPHLPSTNLPILLSEQTIEYQVYNHFVNCLPFFLRPFFFFDLWKLKYWEKFFWKKATTLVAVSEADKKKMKKIIPSLKVEIIPNGAGEDLVKVYKYKKKLNRPVFLYQGNFSWLQNTEAAQFLAEKIFPLIKKRIKNAICYIAGQRAKEKLSHLKREGIKIVDIPPEKKEKVKKIYQKASIFLAPIFGPGGTRLKILGAMAAGLPVITTSIGAEGLKISHKKNILIANTPAEFLKWTLFLVKSPSFYKKIVKNARQLVEKEYNWQKIAQQLEKLYQKTINK